jgi:hypothetical protein
MTGPESLATRLVSIVACLGALTAVGHAEAPGAPPGDSPPVPAASPDQAQAYDRAFHALLDGDVAGAAATFDDLAAHAQDPGLAARARELGRLSHEMLARGLRLVAGGAATKNELESEDQVDGRTSFIVWSTMYSLYGGIVVIDDANISDVRAGILTVTATTAAGLFGSYFATKDQTMTGAMADSYSLGMIEGFANAGLLVHPVGLTGSSERVQTTLLVSGAAGAGIGLAWGSGGKPTRGQVAFAGTLSLLGFASTGLGLGLLHSNGMSEDTVLWTMAGGLDGGLAAGIGFGSDVDWSVSRGRLIQLGTLLGALTGAAGGFLIIGGNSSSSDSGRLISGTTLAGLWGGFALAAHLTRDMLKDRRYQTAPSTQLAPMPVPGGGGVSVVGAF